MTRLFSSLRRATGNLRKNWVISLITVAIISVCLFLVGGYVLLTANLGQAVRTWRSDLRVTLYLQDGASEEDAAALQDRLSSFPEVKSVAYISKDQALSDFTASLGPDAGILDGLAQNPLPASLVITPRPEFGTSGGILAVVRRIGDVPVVQDIDYGQDWLGRVEDLLGVLRLGAVGLGVILSLAAVFIISNTIRITVMARREELEIMRLVGATEGFIRMPFLLEGAIQGTLGACMALGLLAGVHQIIKARLDAGLLSTLGLESLVFLDGQSAVALLAGGMLLGGLGSLASVGKFSRT